MSDEQHCSRCGRLVIPTEAEAEVLREIERMGLDKPTVLCAECEKEPVQ